MNKIKTSKGLLKYRDPNILEAITLVRTLRDYFSSNDHVGAKLSIMENMKDLLDFSEMEGIKSFDDLNNCGVEFISALYEASEDILNKIVGAFAKKD